MAYQVFVSHTQKDKIFCDQFDNICVRPGVGIEVFRSEFETIGLPAWLTIRDAMRKSRAMFLLVGPELVASQASPYEQETWKYTQNWIAYEIGLACQRDIDVWVVCDEGVEINFPVPYFNNYQPFGLRPGPNFDFMRAILSLYSQGLTFRLGTLNREVRCPYDDCQAEFNLHAELQPSQTIICPQCLRVIVFNEGFLLD